MAVRYRFEFDDVDGNLCVGEISNDNYTGSTVELNGSASLSKDLSDNVAQPIQAKAVNVKLLATIEQPLEDIYNEDDRYWLFTYKRNGLSVFQGYVSTEDMEQSYSASKWYLNFDCLDHLSYLEDFGYYDSAGLPYSGTDTLLNILIKCFDRGFNSGDPKLGVITSHFLDHASTDLFTSVYLDQDQFYDDEGESEDCKTVLEDILKSVGCFVIQFRLNFVIMAVKNFVKLRSENVSYNSYTSTGVFQASLNFSPNDAQDIVGSEQNGFPVHFVSANQSFIRKKFYNTFRVRHDFEYVDETLVNPELDNDLVTIDGWTIDGNSTLITGGVRIDSTSGVSFAERLKSDAVPLETNDALEFEVQYEASQSFNNGFRMEIVIELVGSSDTYRLVYKDVIDEVVWARSTDPYYNNRLFTVTLELPSTTETQAISFSAPPLPVDGDLTVTINPPRENDSPGASFTVDILNVSMSPRSQALEAEEFTFRRTDKDTGSVEDTYGIRFNTSSKEILKNVFLDSSGVPIPNFERISTGADVVIADELALMFLNLFSQNHIEFSGDVKNNFEFTPKELSGLGTHFIVLNETKDLTNNVSSMKLLQVQETELNISQYTSEKTRIYRDPVKPVIKS